MIPPVLQRLKYNLHRLTFVRPCVRVNGRPPFVGLIKIESTEMYAVLVYVTCQLLYPCQSKSLFRGSGCPGLGPAI